MPPTQLTRIADYKWESAIFCQFKNEPGQNENAALSVNDASLIFQDKIYIYRNDFHVLRRDTH
jgi:hypothetical protein